MWDTVTVLPVGPKIPPETLQRLVDYARERAQPIMFLEHEVEDGEYVNTRHLATGSPEFIDEAKNGLQEEDVWRA